mgnify:CR=1 FL=1
MNDVQSLNISCSIVDELIARIVASIEDPNSSEQFWDVIADTCVLHHIDLPALEDATKRLVVSGSVIEYQKYMELIAKMLKLQRLHIK